MARMTGPSMSAFDAWILSKSLETLTVRMEQHCKNAMTLAKYLSQLNSVKNVKYPFLPSHPQMRLAKKQMKHGGALVTFELKGGKKQCLAFIDRLKMFSLTSNLGDLRTTITHPSTTTHSKLSPDEQKAVGITESMIRVSVGLEHIDDIIADIEQAMSSTWKG
jgi:O-succinylhomoserine sulfhydrylase